MHDRLAERDVAVGVQRQKLAFGGQYHLEIANRSACGDPDGQVTFVMFDDTAGLGQFYMPLRWRVAQCAVCDAVVDDGQLFPGTVAHQVRHGGGAVDFGGRVGRVGFCHGQSLEGKRGLPASGLLMKPLRRPSNYSAPPGTLTAIGLSNSTRSRSLGIFFESLRR